MNTVPMSFIHSFILQTSKQQVLLKVSEAGHKAKYLVQYFSGEKENTKTNSYHLFQIMVSAMEEGEWMALHHFRESGQGSTL